MGSEARVAAGRARGVAMGIFEADNVTGVDMNARDRGAPLPPHPRPNPSPNPNPFFNA